MRESDFLKNRKQKSHSLTKKNTIWMNENYAKWMQLFVTEHARFYILSNLAKPRCSLQTFLYEIQLNHCSVEQLLSNCSVNNWTTDRVENFLKNCITESVEQLFSWTTERQILLQSC